MEGLKKVTGKNYEDITICLRDNDIEFEIIREPGTENNFFRDSEIWVATVEDMYRLKEIIGEPDLDRVYRTGPSMFYYANYEVQDGFHSSSTLDGLIRFNDGHLVERVVVRKHSS
ncbi:MAG: hypothetical protein ABIG93_00600 [archaeon]|nr:hypothetical protein [Nanoarchaeota archaeon]